MSNSDTSSLSDSCSSDLERMSVEELKAKVKTLREERRILKRDKRMAVVLDHLRKRQRYYRNHGYEDMTDLINRVVDDLKRSLQSINYDAEVTFIHGPDYRYHDGSTLIPKTILIKRKSDMIKLTVRADDIHWLTDGECSLDIRDITLL